MRRIRQVRMIRSDQDRLFDYNSQTHLPRGMSIFRALREKQFSPDRSYDEEKIRSLYT